MNAVAILRALGPIDAKSVRRDSLLRWMLLIPLLFAFLFRWGVPPVSRWLGRDFGIDVLPYHPLIASMLVLLSPMMFGTVIGFLLLDEKDDRTLTALQVTPLSTAGYLSYRLGLPMVISVVLTVLSLQLSSVSEISVGRQLVAAVGAAPLAPAFALLLGGFARNKVEGFALTKAAGVINWPPMIAWFVAPPWQWVFGLVPTYWPAKLYWDLAAGNPGAWLSLPMSILYFALVCATLLRRFDRVIHQ